LRRQHIGTIEMATSSNCKVYLSDEGYGHIVRQRAILEELLELIPNLSCDIQTHKHIDAVQRLIPHAHPIDKFNNILWHKQANGSPDVDAIRTQFADYIDVSDRFIEDELSELNYNFILSDLVYEAFDIGKRAGIPSFGVAHFTWDWFFSKLYPPPVQTEVINRFFDLAAQASCLYFPPFTPEEILNHYKPNSLQVPLILRRHIDHKLSEKTDRFKVLIIDSGAGVLAKRIRVALEHIRGLSDFQFFVSAKLSEPSNNISIIPEGELMADYISDMDLVIGRAGFNTISECIGMRTPMLLIGEAMNPEMNENILNLKKEHLGSFISMDTFENGLDRFLPAFLLHEYKFIQQSMNDHDIATNGAEVIAKDILSKI
jgi:hypothetical protein